MFGFGQQQQPQQQQQQQPGAFGTATSAFGGGNAGTGAFGAQQAPAATTGGFGATPFGAGGFGAAGATAQPTMGGFGQVAPAPATGAFGAPQTAAGTTGAFGAGGFGTATPAPSTAASGFGGFGQQAARPAGFGAAPTFGTAAPTTTSTFGGTTTGTFGQPPAATLTAAPATSAWGSTTTNVQGTTGGLFGGGANTTAAPGGFGATNTSGSLLGGGGAAGGAAGQPTSHMVNNGTGNPAYTITLEKDPGTAVNQSYHSINMMQAYKNWSFEELRLRDYELGKKYAGAQVSSGFGASTPAGTTAAGGFGAQPTATAGTGFGFGAQPQPVTGSMFGGAAPAATTTAPTSGFGFGVQPAPTAATGFGAPAQQQTSGFGGSAFGQQPAATAAPTTTTGFGFGQQQQQQPSTGLFGQKPATSGFGAPASTATPSFGGAFGAQQQTQQPALGGFGTSGTTSAFGQPAQQQQPKPGFGFGSTATTTTTGAAPASGGFGFGASATQQPTAATGAFGQPAAAAPTTTTGFGFGAQATTAQPSTTAPTLGGFGSGFGANTGAPGTTGGFGLGGATTNAPATTGTTTGGLFGQQQQPAAAGTAAGGFSFGAKPANAAPTTTSTFGFGQQQPAAATATTGQTPSFGFGAGGTTGSALGTAQTATTLGATAAAKPAFSLGGMFPPSSTAAGTTAVTQQPTTSMFGTSFGQTATQSQGAGASTSAPTGPALTATIDSNAYGATPLLQPKAPVTEKKADQFRITLSSAAGSTSAMKKSVVLPQHRFFPTPKRDVRLKKDFVTSVSRPSPAAGPTMTLSDAMRVPEKLVFSTDHMQTRRSVKKLEISESEREASSTRSIFADTPMRRKEEREASASTQPVSDRKKVTWDFDRSRDASFATDAAPFDSPMPVKKLDFTAAAAAASSTSRPREQDSFALDANESRLHTSGTGFSKTATSAAPAESQAPKDYYTKPSLAELERLDNSQLKRVASFEVGRHGFGSVRWLQPVDLTVFLRAGAPHRGLDFIPGHIVKFTKKICSVYEDQGENKHELGTGLNCPAEICLVGCWPLDRATKQPVTGTASPRVKHFVTKLKSIPETSFVSYEPGKGEWTFRVEHFSRYGLPDGLEYEEEAQAQAQANAMAVESSTIAAKTANEAQQQESMDMDTSEAELVPERESIADNVMMEDGATARVPAGTPAHAAGLDARRLHLMRKSLFPSTTKQAPTDVESGGISVKPRSVPLAENYQFAEMMEEKEKILPTVAPAFDADRMQKLQESLAIQEQELQETRNFFYQPPYIPPGKLEEPPAAIPIDITATTNIVPTAKKSLPVVPLADSFVNGRERNRSDANLLLGRSFRACWGWLPCGNGTTKMVVLRAGVSMENQRTISIESVKIGALTAKNDNLDVQKVYETCLNIQLEHSDAQTNLETPLLRPISFSSFTDQLSFPSKLTDTSTLHDRLSSFEKSVWKLGWSLFDSLSLATEDRSMESGPDDSLRLEYITEQKRKDRFSRWLKDVTRPLAKFDIQKLVQESDQEKKTADILFALLSCRNISEAHSVALGSRSFFLATILAQLSDNSGANCDFSGSGGLDDRIREDLYNQVKIWLGPSIGPANRSAMIPPEYIRIYRLLCSDLDAVHQELADSGMDLDWKRTFGMYFWYWAMSNNKMADSLAAYDYAHLSLDELKNQVRAPVPWYVEWNGNGSGEGEADEFDLLYHLLKLYAYPEYPLEKVLRPLSYYPPAISAVKEFQWGPVPSVRLLWHLHQVLRSQNVRSLESTDGNAMAVDGDMVTENWTGAYLNMAYVMELEHGGLWQWAIFVALHFGNPAVRKQVVQQLLARHIRYDPQSKEHLAKWEWSFPTHFFLHERTSKRSIVSRSPIKAGSANDSPTSSHHERMLVDKIGIPVEMIFEAKALLARSRGDLVSEAAFLLSAKRENEAHRVVLLHLLPVAFVKRQMNLVRQLLAPFSPGRVHNWASGAGLFQEYLAVRDLVAEITVQMQAGPLEVDSAVGAVIALMRRLSGLEVKRTRGDLDVRPFFENLYFRVSISEMSSHLQGMLMDLQRISSTALVGTRALLQHAQSCCESAPLSTSARVTQMQNLVADYFDLVAAN